MDETVHVLCVDDEPRVTEALATNLGRHFRVSTAQNGQTGLAIVESDDPPVVVISDMHMPEMDGAVFLSEVRERAPDIVRILLTGQADIESAVAAVNHGQIYRFLTKPCKLDALLVAVRAGVEQHRLITSERVLLDQTLRGSIQAVTDILSLTNPLAFGRSIRLKRLCRELVSALGMPLSWQIEVAAMLSQIGCIALPPDTHEKLYYGRPLTHAEEQMVQRLPSVTVQLIEEIPRLEAVRAILQNERNNYDGTGNAPGTPQGAAIPAGARILRIVGDYDTLEAAGHAPEDAISVLQRQKGKYDPEMLLAFVRTRTSPPASETCPIALADVRPGMLLVHGLISTDGTLLVARGQEVSIGLLQRLRNLPKGTVREPITVLVSVEPKPSIQSRP